MYLQLFGEGSSDLHGFELFLFASLQPAAEIPKSPARAVRECISRLFLFHRLIITNSNLCLNTISVCACPCDFVRPCDLLSSPSPLKHPVPCLIQIVALVSYVKLCHPSM